MTAQVKDGRTAPYRVCKGYVVVHLIDTTPTQRLPTIRAEVFGPFTSRKAADEERLNRRTYEGEWFVTDLWEGFT